MDACMQISSHGEKSSNRYSAAEADRYVGSKDFLQDQHNDVETIWMVKTHKLLERINNMMLGITNIVI